MNPTELLRDQQRDLLSLFDELEITDDGLQRARLIGVLAMRIKRHAALKEDVFYPAVRVQQPQGVEEALAAHRAVDLLLDESVGTPTDSNVKVLRGVVEQLFAAEESLFAVADDLDDDARTGLAERLDRYAHAVEETELEEERL
jgi:hypothetical protein